MRHKYWFLAAATAAVTATAQSGARPDPVDPQARVPLAPYRSAFEGYRSLEEPKRIPWRDANAEVGRFAVRNDGKAMHEMVIGTMEQLEEHAELMREFPGMEHDEPYMAHVAPGEEGEIVWKFTRAGEFHYACLVPGHLEAGMIARIIVK